MGSTGGTTLLWFVISLSLPGSKPWTPIRRSILIVYQTPQLSFLKKMYRQGWVKLYFNIIPLCWLTVFVHVGFFVLLITKRQIITRLACECSVSDCRHGGVGYGLDCALGLCMINSMFASVFCQLDFWCLIIYSCEIEWSRSLSWKLLHGLLIDFCVFIFHRCKFPKVLKSKHLAAFSKSVWKQFTYAIVFFLTWGLGIRLLRAPTGSDINCQLGTHVLFISCSIFV